jgi:hypothetical protein
MVNAALQARIVGVCAPALLVLACSAEAGVDRWRDGISRAVTRHVESQGLNGRSVSVAQPPYCDSISAPVSQEGRVCLSEPRNFKGGVVVRAEVIGREDEWELAAAMIDGRWVVTDVRAIP